MSTAPTTRKLTSCDWLLDALPYAVIAVDQQQNIILSNLAAQTLFGYEPQELLGKPLAQLIPQSLRERHTRWVDAYHGAPERRTMGTGRDLTGQRKDGSAIPVEIALSPTITAMGPVTLASIMDVTERKLRENELRRSNRDLEQFAYVASHDLKEPLRMIASFLTLLDRKYSGQLDAEASRYIHFAVDGAARMQRLINGLLAFSRIRSQAMNLLPVDSAQALNAALLNLSQVVDETGATIEAGSLPTVMGDAQLLQQLFQNLIDNALKFRSDKPPHITVTTVATHSDRATICIRDNGIGFDMAHRERVFEMFNRLHEVGKYDGAGIGLTLTKRIVERFGGTISVESTLGEGTAFYVDLPLAPLSQPNREAAAPK